MLTVNDGLKIMRK